MSEKTENAWMNNAPVHQRLHSWIKTTRIQTALVTALAIWVGHVTVTQMDFIDIVGLGLVGLFVHVWGFTLNEVEDYQYDKANGDVEGHPIAQGKVHAGAARVLAWIAAGVSVITMIAINANMVSITALILSFIPGYAYDKYSKVHWWANGYLAVWAIMMVLTGALYAGTPTIYTSIISTAVGIQIFVQVIQGDLKDFNADEKSFTRMCGVRLEDISATLDGKYFGQDSRASYDIDTSILAYSRTFSSIVYGLKLFEAALLVSLVVITLESTGMFAYLITASIIVGSIAFMATTSSFMVYVYDRDLIKKNSSKHELISILMLGIAVVGLDPASAILIAVSPILWYLLTNSALHSSSLNPDV